MSGNTFGRLFRITSFGESHGDAVGVVIDGCPAGLKISEKDIQTDLDKRKPGSGKAGTKRKESDKAKILSGIFEGKTTGTPICIVVSNEDANSKSYEHLKNVFRPGHADYTYFEKYGVRDYRGGGRSSGRETLARVAAGAVAKKILETKKIVINGFVKSIGGVVCENYSMNDIENIYSNEYRCPDSNAIKEIGELMEEVIKKGDSVGGTVEIIVRGVPTGLGEPVFEKLDANIAKALMSIGAVKGVELGAGFESSKMLGSESNDELLVKGSKVLFKTNNSGGILGGISNGSEIIAKIAVKPTPSISVEQQTITTGKKQTKISVAGRHDYCICPRIVPVAEAMMAIVLADALLEHNARKI